MMTEDEKAAVREQKAVAADRLQRAFAPLFLGQHCPLRNEECLGPACMWFLRQVDGDKIVDGNCSFNIIASNLAPLAHGLLTLAENTSGQKPGDVQRVIVGGQS